MNNLRRSLELHAYDGCVADEVRKLGFTTWRHTFESARDGIRRSTDYLSISIDGQPLIEFFREHDDSGIRRERRELVRRQLEELGRPPATDRTRDWRDPAAADLLCSPHLFGVPARRWQFFTGEPTVGFVGLLVCGCGIQGCEAVIADFDEQDGRITWSRFRSATDASHDPLPRFEASPPPALVFDSAQYREAVARAAARKVFDGDPTPDLPLRPWPWEQPEAAVS